MEIVTVTNIDYIKEDITYYYVASTRYYNVIANGFLTNNGIEFTSFLYSFNSDLTWGKEREEYLQQNDFFQYENWKNYFPKYLFYGLRMDEAKNIANQGMLDLELVLNKLNYSNTLETMKNNNGNIVWMVTTSDDEVNSINKKTYLKEYESTYILPEPQNKENFIGWLNTADNKIYQSKDAVKVLYGMHFIAQYQ